MRVLRLHHTIAFATELLEYRTRRDPLMAFSRGTPIPPSSLHVAPRLSAIVLPAECGIELGAVDAAVLVLRLEGG